jgi:uncharacterized protein YjiS (DUF1127 family)
MIVSWIVAAVRRELFLRRTQNTLNGLNDRELADLGIERWEIGGADRANGQRR